MIEVYPYLKETGDIFRPEVQFQALEGEYSVGGAVSVFDIEEKTLRLELTSFRDSTVKDLLERAALGYARERGIISAVYNGNTVNLEEFFAVKCSEICGTENRSV